MDLLTHSIQQPGFHASRTHLLLSASASPRPSNSQHMSLQLGPTMLATQNVSPSTLQLLRQGHPQAKPQPHTPVGRSRPPVTADLPESCSRLFTGSVALGCCVTVKVVCASIAWFPVWALALRIQLFAFHAMRGAACLGVCALARLSTGAAMCRHSCPTPAAMQRSI